MHINVHHTCIDALSYRAARIKSLFNVTSGAEVKISARLPIEDHPWAIGMIVGPSGSGKTSIGKALAESVPGGVFYVPGNWPDIAVIDAIAPDAPADDVTAALSAVGLGTVPAWLRPYRALSNGERFRADLARIICEPPEMVVIDEFTSVVDRQIARIGALAFGKAWRRTGRRAAVLSCHYDVADWLDPDWIYDTANGEFAWRCHRRRPEIRLDIYGCGWRHWPAFETHHYLKLPRMIAADCYVGAVAGVPVAHIAVTTRPGLREARACRLVIMPEWQGAGVGLRFLNAVCGMWRRGQNRYGKPMPVLFHTSHPSLAAALRRHPLWAQVSCSLYGAHRGRSRASMVRSGNKTATGYGGHFRAVQGFRYCEGL